MGEPKHAAHYCGKLAPSLRCLTHETPEPYFAYGVGRAGLLEMAAPKVFMAGMEAARKGHMVGQVIGDPRMKPGSFLVDRGGHVQWTYYASDISDHPALEAIIDAARSLKAENR